MKSIYRATGLALLVGVACGVAEEVEWKPAGSIRRFADDLSDPIPGITRHQDVEWRAAGSEKPFEMETFVIEQVGFTEPQPLPTTPMELPIVHIQEIKEEWTPVHPE